MSNRYYVIENNKVVNIIKANSPSDLPDLTLVPWDDNIRDGTGWNYINGQWVEVDSYDLSLLKESRKKELASIRWQKEISGTTFLGFSLMTDEVSQTKVLGAALAATLDPNYTVNWKTSSGFVELNATQVLGVAQAIRGHIQACYDVENQKINEIDVALNSNELYQIDLTSGWPE